MSNSDNSDKKITDTLKPSQRRAIIALLSEKDVKSAAIAAQVSERSIHRWLEDTEFTMHLAAAEGQAIAHVTRRLTRLSDLAAQVIEDILNSEKASAGAKLRAADLVIGNLLRLRELASAESRIRSLEKLLLRQNEQKSGPPFN